MFGWFRKKISPANDDLNPNRALEFFSRGDYGEALRRAKAIVSAGPQIALSWQFHGECLFHVERYAEAVESFGRATQLGGPGTEETFLWQALSLHNGGQREEAKQVIRDFLLSESATSELVAKAQGALAKLESGT